MNVVEGPSRRMAELIDTLLEQTRSGAITWKRTDLPGAFMYLGKTGSVVVRGPSSTLSSIVNGLSIQALDARGDKVESYVDGSAFTGGGSYGPLSALLSEVRRRTSDGDPLLDTLRLEVASARKSE